MTPDTDGKCARAFVALDDIRCDLLDSGLVTLADAENDADPELTPRRLVRALIQRVQGENPT